MCPAVVDAVGLASSARGMTMHANWFDPETYGGCRRRVSDLRPYPACDHCGHPFPCRNNCARRVQEIRATCGRDRASPRRSRFSEPHAAPRTATAPSPASPALPRRASSRERGCVSENLSHVPEPFTLIRRSSWGKVWPCFLLFYHFPRHCFPTCTKGKHSRTASNLHVSAPGGP